MFRFLAFAWQNPDQDRSAEISLHVAKIAGRDSSAWSLAYRASGLEIWHSGSRPGHMETFLLPGGGALLGRALSRADGFPDWTPGSLADATGSLNPIKQARWLIANIWGSYVGFFPQQHDYPLAVVRDPVGGLPCYRVRWQDFDIFTSNIEMLKPLPGLNLSVDLDALTTAVLLPFVCKDGTCLTGVQKVLPGECLSLSEQERRTFLWDPVAISRNALKLDVDEAAALVRETLVKIVDALVRPYRRVLHSLGGLDSSIVLSCLTAGRSPPEITCFNYYTATFTGDERGYARKMSAHAGVPLIERQLDLDKVDLDAWRAQEMGASPPSMFDCVTLAGDTKGLADELAADVLSNGLGGDSVFFESPYIFPALDYVATNAPFGKLGHVALEAAQLGQWSLARTVLAMVREKLRPPRCFDSIVRLLEPGTSAHYLNIDPLTDRKTPDYLHPMLKVEDEFPKGKYFQILGSSFINLEDHRYRLPGNGDIDYICPLVAQPFVELFLRIPTWQLADGGIGRGLARRAFWEHLPREISGRTSKSTEQGLYEHLFAKDLPRIRETLLEGTLTRSGFFNRGHLELALSEHRDLSITHDPATFFDLYAWEAWASRWDA